jgi:hypothetical protein
VLSLGDIHTDPNLPGPVRTEFLVDLRQHVEKMTTASNNLFEELRTLAHAKPDRYLRKGPRVGTVDYVSSKLGGLQRALSLRACAMMVTEEFYSRAAKVVQLPEFAAYRWEHTPLVASAIKSRLVEFDPMRDLRPDAMIQGRESGSSGWYFAAADARDAIHSAKAMQSQLAVGPEYADGYVVLDLPSEVAAPPDSKRDGAHRPTALDLTVDPAGKLNENVDEPVGRTNPHNADQKQIREVVMPPVSLSVIAKRTYIRGGDQ